MTEYTKIRDEEARPTYGGGGLFGLFEGEPPPRMTGWLNKQSRGKSGFFSSFTKGLKWDKRFFVLENQLIRYYEHEVDENTTKDMKGEVNLMGAIILTDVTQHTNGKTGDYIGISLDNGVTCELLLDALDTETCEKWKEGIDKHIKAQKDIIPGSNNDRKSTSIIDEDNGDFFAGWCSFLSWCSDDDAEPPEYNEWAMKFSRSRKMFSFLFRNWRKRYFLLKEGKITYYEFCEDGQQPTGYKGFLSLYSASLIEDATQFSNDSEGIYLGVSLDDGASCELLLKVEDDEKRLEWLAKLRHHIEFAKANPTIANALPGEEVNALSVLSDRLASSGLRSMNRLINLFVNSAPRNERDESGFYIEEEAAAMASLDRDGLNEVENQERMAALDNFKALVKKQFPKGVFSTIPTCFVFKEPPKKDDDKESEGEEKKANTKTEKTSKEHFLELLKTKKVANKPLGEVIINQSHTFVGGHVLTFIVVAWYVGPLDSLAKKQNQLVLMDRVAITKLHETIQDEIRKKDKAADGTLLYSPDKYKLPPTGRDAEEFEGVKLYSSAYESIYTNYSMVRLLEAGLGSSLQFNSNVSDLKKINLALDWLEFYYDDSIQNGQLIVYYPLHGDIVKVEHKFTTDSFLALPWDYDVSCLRNYFGERLGYYFRFTQHYAFYLAFLAAFSAVMEIWLFFSGASRGTPIAIFSGVVVFWGGLLMADWTYQADIQSFEWGMDSYENVAIVRPQFKETLVIDPYDNKDKELTQMNKEARDTAHDLEDEEQSMDSGILFSIHLPFNLYSIHVPKLYCCWGKAKDSEGKKQTAEDEAKFDDDILGWIQFKIGGLLLGGSETVRSPVDGHLEYVYRSRANHSLRKWIAFAVMVASAGVVVASTFGVYYLQAYMSIQAGSGFVAENSAKITSFLNNAQTAIFAPVVSYIMICMNDFENHRTITAYDEALIMKKSCLVFVNTFFCYYYIAFIAQNVVYDFGGEDVDASRSCGGYATCMDALCNTMLFAVITDFTSLVKTRIEKPIWDYLHNIYIQEFNEVADYIGQFFFTAPLKPQKNILKKNKDDLNNFAREVVKQYAHRASSGSYTGTHLFEDYTKLFIQFGYLMLFLPSLPAVSIICFFTCWAELKLDVQKLMDEFLRPFPEGSPDIGSWRGSFNAMALAAVPTNAAVVVFTMNAFNLESFTIKLVLFIAMQWFILVVLYIAKAIYSGGSVKVTVQRARAKNIIQNLENLIGDRKLAKSDNALQLQIQETEQLKKANKDLQSKITSRDSEIARLKAAK